MQKLTQALRRDSSQPSTSGLIAPELARRKEALEAFPLDSMAMVGSMNRNGQPVALVTRRQAALSGAGRQLPGTQLRAHHPYQRNRTRLA